MFDKVEIDAILLSAGLSAGGNDLKNVFAALFEARARRDRGLRAEWNEVDSRSW